MPPPDVTPAIRTAPSAFYRAYLNSPAWRARRNVKLKQAKYRCERCHAKRDLEVHHKTYDRLGAELDSDLEVVCHDCHRGHHLETESQDERLSVFIRIASESLRVLGPWAAIADLSDYAKTICAEAHIPYEKHQIDRALEMVCGKRLQTAKPGQAAEPNAIGQQAEHDINKSEAYELLNRLVGGAVPGFQPIKVMPQVHPATARQVDQAKALQVIFAAIEDSVRRCEELEQDAPKDAE